MYKCNKLSTECIDPKCVHNIHDIITLFPPTIIKISPNLIFIAFENEEDYNKFKKSKEHLSWISLNEKIHFYKPNYHIFRIIEGLNSSVNTCGCNLCVNKKNNDLIVCGTFEPQTIQFENMDDNFIKKYSYTNKPVCENPIFDYFDDIRFV